MDQIKNKPELKLMTYHKVVAILKDQGWDAIEEHDPNWGDIVLATKKDPGHGTVLRRVKLFYGSREKATLLQQKLRKDLVEVWLTKSYYDENNHPKTEYEPLWVLTTEEI